MRKILFFIALFFYSSLLFSFQREKKWKNENNFQKTLEKLMQRCIRHQHRLVDQNILDEDLILKTHDALKIEKLRKKNPELKEAYQAALQKSFRSN